METELNFNASFQKTGEIIIETKSNKEIEDVILWIYSEDGDHKIAEKRLILMSSPDTIRLINLKGQI